MLAEENPKLDQLKALMHHREPMILLDEVLYCEQGRARLAVTINLQSAFFNQELGGVPAWVGIEYMAQAITAWSGSRQVAQGLPVTVGFLLGARRYQSELPCFNNGSRLFVDIDVLYVDASGLSAFDCTISDVSERGALTVLASARINAFRPENPEQFVHGEKDNEAVINQQ